MTITKSKPALTVVKDIKDKGKPTAPNPPLPASLPAPMAKEWKEMIVYLHEHGIYKIQKLGLVESYLICLMQVRVAQSQFAKDGYFDTQGRLHQAHTLMSKAITGMTNLAKSLGLAIDPRSLNAVANEGKKFDLPVTESKWSIK